MITVPPDAAPGQSVGIGRRDPDREPVLPEHSRDDTDIGWGEEPKPDDDERLRRERPPHWDDF
jgi:hypothetical protein